MIAVSKGWSQEHLAQAAGIREKTIRRAEAGRRVSGETGLAIAAALDVAAEALAAGEPFAAAPLRAKATGPVSRGHVPGRGVGSRSVSRSDRPESGGGWPDGGHRGDFR